MSAALHSIEGGRAIAARDVAASLAVDADTVATGTENVAGYVILAWDDEGSFSIAHHFGKRNPYAPAMLADVLRSRISARIIEAEDEAE